MVQFSRSAAGVPLSRRSALTAGVALAIGGGLAAVAPAAGATTRVPGRFGGRTPDATRRALGFLDAATDGYPTSNPGVRLAQSYADELGLFSTAFVYDNALAVNAYLAEASPHSVERARLLGDGLLYAQSHDPGYSDGRLRQAYNVGPYTFYDGSPQPHGLIVPGGGANVGAQFGFVGTAVGDMAWPGIALAQLAERTGDRRYLDGALRIAHWIVDRAYSEQRLGGFRFGVDGSDTLLPFSSTEHNLDVAGFFRQLGQLTRNREWLELADHALAFVARMYDPAGGFFNTGTNDGITINTDPVPLDTQTWGWLVLRDEDGSRALDWADAHLRTTDVAGVPTSQLPTGFSVDGVTFSSRSLTSTATYNSIQVHPDGVWMEGTGQLACAWADRGARGDRDRLTAQLAQLESVQRTLGKGQRVGGSPLPAAAGVVAASSLIDTGFGFGYFQVQHVGATSWYVLGALGGNPYRTGGLRRGGR